MAGEFTDEGTETHFAIGSQPAYVKAVRRGPGHAQKSTVPCFKTTNSCSGEFGEQAVGYPALAGGPRHRGPGVPRVAHPDEELRANGS